MMNRPFLRDYQKEAVKKMKVGCILNGDVGTGKSRTSLYYYFSFCGGDVDPYKPMTKPMDLYIITTAHKRDTFEWDEEMVPFLLSQNPECCESKVKCVVDSWNNIRKYEEIENSFFIFDEDRVVGSGAWVKAFLKITKKNPWILLSATPGDTWIEYWAVFVANGFYRNKSDFIHQHVVYNQFVRNFPSIKGYFNTNLLEKHRAELLVDMKYERDTVPIHENVWCEFNKSAYLTIFKDRWNEEEQKPIENAAELCYLARKVINSDPSRAVALLEITEKHPKCIIFYSYDYELDILLNLGYYPGTEITQWNGHKHENIPDSVRWVYLVQYTAGCEGWNCITTDTMIFYSQQYSYKVLKQACGRTDRMNTPFKELYYYHLKSRAGIDLAISKAISEKKQFNERKWVIW